MRFISLAQGEAPDVAAQRALSDNEMPCVLELSCENHWSVEGDIPLLAAFERDLSDGSLRCLIAADNDYSQDVFEISSCLEDAAAELALPVFSQNRAINCLPHHEPKPWGEEIWFTGIEARGVSEVGEVGCSIPLPWLLAVAPSWFGGVQQLVLLKSLAPRPEPVWGDLYLELHRKKQEVYVISAVDESAWPAGKGQIRLGVPPDLVSNDNKKQEFMSSFSSSISAYGACRQKIDAELDRCRLEAGLTLNEPVDPKQQEQWLQALPAEWIEQERRLRDQLFAHTQLHDLEPGDVVKVPTLTPHSLQHGVRAVEFQTPVYERLIVAFAQKVLTQDHWNSEEALSLMNLDARLDRELERVSEAPGAVVESVVRFDDFSVDRVTLSQGASFQWSGAVYSLWMTIKGQPELAGHRLNPEQAAVMAAGCGDLTVTHEGEGDWVFLLARPCL